MKRKKQFLLGICAVILVVLNVLILSHKGNVNGICQFHVELTADKPLEIQVFYGTGKEFSETASVKSTYEKAETSQEMVFSIPSTTSWIRLDLGDESAEVELRNVYLNYEQIQEGFPELEDLENMEGNQIAKVGTSETGYVFVTDGEDPFIYLQTETGAINAELAKKNQTKNMIINILMLVLLDGAAVIAFIFRKKILTLPMELYQNKALIWKLARNDFKTKYAGSYLGIIWAFIQPVVTILVYWFVFSVGLRAGNVSEYPFVLYLVSGIVPWFFFQDALNGGTNALLEYNYLVKKVVFKISVLPIVKIISALFVHGFFVGFALVLCWCYGYGPSLATLQIFYYSACTCLLTLGLVYATSAVVVFFRDLTQIISIFLQVGVWLTPIMWDVNILANYPLLMKAFKLNPMYYIVTGYRDAMLNHVWFWHHWGWTLYFWAVTIALFGIGTVIFKRLKPHFADVL